MVRRNQVLWLCETARFSLKATGERIDTLAITPIVLLPVSERITHFLTRGIAQQGSPHAHARRRDRRGQSHAALVPAG